VFYVNIPIAAVAFVGGLTEIKEPRDSRNPSPLDIPGTLLGTFGLVALVYGFTRAETDGWTDPVTLGMFVATIVLLGVFVLVERKVAAPLLPMRVVLDRNRGGVYLSLGLAIVSMFGLFLFLTYYLQIVEGYSPVRTGLAFLPMVAGMITGSTQVGARLMTRIPARYLMGPGLAVAAVGMLMLTQLEPGSSYVGLILPAQILLGVGLGTTFMPAMSLATYGVEPRDSGIASAMINTSQQVGGAIGIALLNTIAASSTTAYVAANIGGSTPAEQVQVQAMVHGYTSAIWWAVVILAAAALIAYTFVKADQRTAQVPGGEGSADDAAPVMVH
jgi:hypothetical protein